MAFKISDAFMAEINKDQESIQNTHNDFYYKRKNENAAIADTVNRSHLSADMCLRVWVWGEKAVKAWWEVRTEASAAGY